MAMRKIEIEFDRNRPMMFLMWEAGLVPETTVVENVLHHEDGTSTVYLYGSNDTNFKMERVQVKICTPKGAK